MSVRLLLAAALLVCAIASGCSGGTAAQNVGVSVNSKPVETFKDQNAAVAKATELAGFLVLPAKELPEGSTVTGVNVVRSGVVAGVQVLVSNPRGGLLIEELQGQPSEASEPWAVAGEDGELLQTTSPGVWIYSLHRNSRVFVITTHSETALSADEAAAILTAFAKAV